MAQFDKYAHCAVALAIAANAIIIRERIVPSSVFVACVSVYFISLKEINATKTSVVGRHRSEPQRRLLIVKDGNDE